MDPTFFWLLSFSLSRCISSHSPNKLSRRKLDRYEKWFTINFKQIRIVSIHTLCDTRFKNSSKKTTKTKFYLRLTKIINISLIEDSLRFLNVLETKKKIIHGANRSNRSKNWLNEPGMALVPCFGLRSLARMTSTSRKPFFWESESWISPRQRAPSACLPTTCPGPRSSMKSLSWPVSPDIRRLGDQLQFPKSKRLANHRKLLRVFIKAGLLKKKRSNEKEKKKVKIRGKKLV